MEVVEGLHAQVYLGDGVNRWYLSDDRSGSEPYNTVLHSEHPLLQADTFEVHESA